MMIDRMDRVQEMLRREISLILNEDINDPRIEHVTIIKVEAARDIRTAKILYTLPDDNPELDRGKIAKSLKGSCSFIRKELSERISMKVIPKLSFIEDKKIGREGSVDELFEKIEDEHHFSENGEEEGGDNDK